MSVEKIIAELKATGHFTAEPLFTPDQLKKEENSLGIELPASYKLLLTTFEPEMSNFYFIKPRRDSKDPGLIVFATWDDDEFAFDSARGMRVRTILRSDMKGREWEDFDGWLAHAWSMSNRPIGTE